MRPTTPSLPTETLAPAERKGERTRRRILDRCAELFNRRGYAAASLGDVMAETGLPKGSLYFHFKDKEHLTREALEHALERAGERFAFVRDPNLSAAEILARVLEAFRSQWDDPLYPGGCPFLNAAVDAERISPEARLFTAETFALRRQRLADVLRRAVAEGHLSPDVDPTAMAALVLSSYQGAMAIARVEGDRAHLDLTLSVLSSMLNVPDASPSRPPLSEVSA